MTKQISRCHLHEPSQTIANFYAFSIESILIIDKWVLNARFRPPCREEWILIDEKALGLSYGFVIMVFQALSVEPIYMSHGEDSHALKAYFASLTREKCHGIPHFFNAIMDIVPCYL